MEGILLGQRVEKELAATRVVVDIKVAAEITEAVADIKVVATVTKAVADTKVAAVTKVVVDTKVVAVHDDKINKGLHNQWF